MTSYATASKPEDPAETAAWEQAKRPKFATGGAVGPATEVLVVPLGQTQADVDAAYERGVAEGRRQATAKIAHEIRAELVCCEIYDKAEGDEDAIRKLERAGHGICFWGEAGARIAERVGPWEAAEQTRPDFAPFAEESLSLARETFATQAQAIDPEAFRQESLGTWPAEQTQDGAR
jgi:hypothetical protein